mgnify:CR=1 FL=1
MSRDLVILFPDFFSFASKGKRRGSNFSRSCESVLTSFFFYSGQYEGYEKELLDVFDLKEVRSSVQSSLINILATNDLEDNDENVILRADPVYLKADQNRVFLFDGQTLAIDNGEAEEILGELNDLYSDELFYFTKGKKPWRWYLRRSGYNPPEGDSPLTLRGSPLEVAETERQNMGELKTLLTEVQMILHASRINEIRTGRNVLPINSLWFWGYERSQKNYSQKTRKSILITNCDLAQNIASAARMNWIDIEAFNESEFEDVKADSLIIIDPTEFESRRSFLEKILINLFAQIRTGTLRRVRLITRLGHFRVTPFSRLKFWKRRAAFSEGTNRQSELGDQLF